MINPKFSKSKFHITHPSNENIENFDNKNVYFNPEKLVVDSCHLDYIKIQEEFNYILCINCEKQVYIDNVPTHSENCISVSKEALLSSNAALDNLMFKLNKLNDSIIKINNLSTLDDIESVVFFKQILKECLSLSLINHKNVTITKKLLNNLDNRFGNYKGNFFIKIFYERIKLLLTEKLRILKKYMERDLSKLYSQTENNRISITKHVSPFNVNLNSPLNSNSFNSLDPIDLITINSDVNYTSSSSQTFISENNSEFNETISELEYKRNLNIKKFLKKQTTFASSSNKIYSDKNLIISRLEKRLKKKEMSIIKEDNSENKI